MFKNKLTESDLIEFEKEVSRIWESGDLPYLIHLSGGNEKFLIDFFSNNVTEGDWVLSSHRNHHHALLSGINKEKLLSEIKSGNSMFVFSKEKNFLTSSILAGTCCIAAGIAIGLKLNKSKNKVWCFLGDGAEEEGHFYEAVLMVEGNDLPCTFIIEDNDRSVDTKITERVTNSFRVNWPKCVIRHKYYPTYPHAGNGTPKKISFNQRIIDEYIQANPS